MNTKKLQALASELAKDVKTLKDLNEQSAFLTKLTVEAALKVEMDDHLGYDILSMIVPLSRLHPHQDRYRCTNKKGSLTSPHIDAF
jgi:transposase-like protein